MALPAIPIITGLFKIAESWLTGYRNKAEARDARETELIRQQGTWEETMAQGSTSSWKDEYWTIVLSVPAILCFIPACVGSVAAGFTALATMPVWYQGLLTIAIGAAFGVRVKTRLDASKSSLQIAETILNPEKPGSDTYPSSTRVDDLIGK